MKSIKVYACPELSEVDEAKAHMRAAALELQIQAADASAEAMFLVSQATRLEMLSELIDEDEAVKVRDMFVNEGLMVIEERKGQKAPNAPGGLA